MRINLLKSYFRKYVKTVVLLLILLFIPIISYADYGLPMTSYYAIITNLNGTDLIDDNGNVITTIPNQTEVAVNWEYIVKGEKYFHITCDKYSGYVYSKDLVPLELEFNKTDSKEYIVFREGASIYNSPGLFYDKLIEVPLDTSLNIFLYDDDFGWGYTTYKGISGWIPIYPYRTSEEYDYTEKNDENVLIMPKTCVAVGKKVNNVSMITLEDITATNFESIIFSKNEDVETIEIPANTIVNVKKYYIFDKYTNYVIDKNNKEYVIKNMEEFGSSLAYEENKVDEANCEIPVYSNVEEHFKVEPIFKIPKDKSYKILYSVNCDLRDFEECEWAYIEFENNRGWIFIGPDFQETNEEFIIDGYLSVYKYFGESEHVYFEENKNIKCDYFIELNNRKYYRFEYNNDYYWVDEYDLNDANSLKKEPKNEINNVINLDNEEEKNNNIEEWNPKKYKKIAVIMVICFLIISIFGLTLNNKTKNKKDDNK